MLVREDTMGVTHAIRQDVLRKGKVKVNIIEDKLTLKGTEMNGQEYVSNDIYLQIARRNTELQRVPR